MPISGLLLTLARDDAERARAIAALSDDACFELGAQDACRVAAVLDTPDDRTNRQRWRWLHELPGVLHVDVVMVTLDEAGVTGPAGALKCS